MGSVVGLLQKEAEAAWWMVGGGWWVVGGGWWMVVGKTYWVRGDTYCFLVDTCTGSGSVSTTLFGTTLSPERVGQCDGYAPPHPHSHTHPHTYTHTPSHTHTPTHTHSPERVGQCDGYVHGRVWLNSTAELATLPCLAERADHDRITRAVLAGETV